jgi:protein CpxP
MKMKQFATVAALALGAVIMLSPSARAQDTAPSTNQPPAGAGGGRQRGMNIQRLKTQLNLTDDQVTKLTPILKDRQDQMMALRNDTTLSQEDRRAKMKDIADAINAKVKAILDPDQFTKWQQMQTRRRQAGQGGQGGGPGGTQPPSTNNPSSN